MSLLTSKECLRVLGDPEREKDMQIWIIPREVWIPAFPQRIYCNKRLIAPLSGVLAALHQRGLSQAIKTYDGCFNIRKVRGAHAISLHSWGVALDIDANWNSLGMIPKINPDVVKCFKEHGFNWGGDFQRLDGMHFELSKEAFNA